MDRRDQISQRAYELWESEGRPEGHAYDHWLRAEREMGETEHADPTPGASEDTGFPGDKAPGGAGESPDSPGLSAGDQRPSPKRSRSVKP